MALRSFDRDDDLICDINIIPLVDISLVLLIIFMVTANFMTTSFIKVDIPKAANGKSAQGSEESVAITINSEGVVYWEKRIVNLKELATKLALRYKENHNISVVLTADKRVEFDSVVAVIDTINGVGIERVNVATETVR